MSVVVAAAVFCLARRRKARNAKMDRVMKIGTAVVMAMMEAWPDLAGAEVSGGTGPAVTEFFGNYDDTEEPGLASLGIVAGATENSVVKPDGKQSVRDSTPNSSVP